MRAAPRAAKSNHLAPFIHNRTINQSWAQSSPNHHINALRRPPYRPPAPPKAEGETFADFLAYVLAAFLLSWSDKLKVRDNLTRGGSTGPWNEIPLFYRALLVWPAQKLEFQELVIFLQSLPTAHWKGSEVRGISIVHTL